MQHSNSYRHIPVLHTADGTASPVLKLLSPTAGDRVLDVTLGLGGHSSAFLEAIGPTGHLTAVDADENNLRLAAERLAPFAGRMTLLHGNFRDISTLAPGPFDIVFADLGLSSPHLDDPDRGFSFRATAPLDMRLDRSVGRPAWALLANSDVGDIARALRVYGEVERAGSLARNIASMFAAARDRTDWTTDDLKACTERVFTYRAPKVLPQVFQAIRIAVNDELGALESLLAAIPALLAPGGRCGIISYHSLEDRLVKQAFRALTTPIQDPHTGGVAKEAEFLPLTKKPVVPSDEEQRANPRSRSARFRVIQHRPTIRR